MGRKVNKFFNLAFLAFLAWMAGLLVIVIINS